MQTWILPKLNLKRLVTPHCVVIIIKTIPLAEVNALQELASLDNIVIPKAGNGKVVVLINKADYVDQMNTILEDSTKFCKPSISENELLGELLQMDYDILLLQVLKPLK